MVDKRAVLDLALKNPVANKALEGALQVKDRVEKLVNGFEALEQRLSSLEKRVETLESTPKPKRRTAAAKKTA